MEPCISITPSVSTRNGPAALKMGGIGEMEHNLP